MRTDTTMDMYSTHVYNIHIIWPDGIIGFGFNQNEKKEVKIYIYKKKIKTKTLFSRFNWNEIESGGRVRARARAFVYKTDKWAKRILIDIWLARMAVTFVRQTFAIPVQNSILIVLFKHFSICDFSPKRSLVKFFMVSKIYERNWAFAQKLIVWHSAVSLANGTTATK